VAADVSNDGGLSDAFDRLALERERQAAAAAEAESAEAEQQRQRFEAIESAIKVQDERIDKAVRAFLDRDPAPNSQVQIGTVERKRFRPIVFETVLDPVYESAHQVFKWGRGGGDEVAFSATVWVGVSGIVRAESSDRRLDASGSAGRLPFVLVVVPDHYERESHRGDILRARTAAERGEWGVEQIERTTDWFIAQLANYLHAASKQDGRSRHRDPAKTRHSACSAVSAVNAEVNRRVNTGSESRRIRPKLIRRDPCL
jgi:hypothetical protein